MDWEASLPFIIALGGGTGIGAGIKTLVDTIIAVRAGVSAKEGKRRQDIVLQRDEALKEAGMERKRANAEMSRADWSENNMRIAIANEQRAREHAADLRVLLIESGVRREQLPPWPSMEDTVPRTTLNDPKE